MTSLVRLVLGMGLAMLLGCGSGAGPALTPVTGTVTMDKKPYAGVRVQFVPEFGTAGQGGDGTTDDLGRYEVSAFPERKAKGLASGTYKVLISKKVLPDGTIAPANTKWAESPAKETVPIPYNKHSTTPFFVTIETDQKPFDFELTSGK